MVTTRLPKGWNMAGSQPTEYEVLMDPDSPGPAGLPCYCIRSAVEAPSGFGTLMQSFDARDFRGQRVRLTATVASRQLDDWAGLWMRIDGRQASGIAFDNMQNRPIRGTTEWTEHAVVLDVAGAAQTIALGLLLHGGGRLWVERFGFEEVGLDVPVTDFYRPGQFLGPQNLDLSE